LKPAQEEKNLITKSQLREAVKAKQFLLHTANRLAIESGAIGYVVDKDNRKVINRLVLYFLGHDVAYTHKGKVYEIKKTKGFLIGGSVGSGKTLLMEAANQTFKAFGYVATARKVAGDFIEEGQKAILKHSKPMKPNGQGYTYPDCFFDDLGAEDSKKHYGNETNVMAELITDRYELFIRNHSKTFFTTNLTRAEMEEKYGPRVMSRLKQMCNFILLDCKTDRRK
jgi:hypothetical protein